MLDALPENFQFRLAVRGGVLRVADGEETENGTSPLNTSSEVPKWSEYVVMVCSRLRGDSVADPWPPTRDSAENSTAPGASNGVLLMVYWKHCKVEEDSSPNVALNDSLAGRMREIFPLIGLYPSGIHSKILESAVDTLTIAGSVSSCVPLHRVTSPPYTLSGGGALPAKKSGAATQ